jgi:hypothetical protein
MVTKYQNSGGQITGKVQINYQEYWVSLSVVPVQSSHEMAKLIHNAESVSDLCECFISETFQIYFDYI